MLFLHFMIGYANKYIFDMNKITSMILFQKEEK